MKNIFLSDVQLITYCGQILNINSLIKNSNNVQLIDSNSKPVKIHSVKKCSQTGIQVLPNKGSSFICGENTNIMMKFNLGNNKKDISKRYSVENKNILDCFELKETIRYFNKKYKLIRCKQLSWKEVKLQIPPYIHGLYTSKESLIIKTSDLDIISKINELGKNQPKDFEFWFDKTLNYIKSKNNWLTHTLKRNTNIYDKFYEKNIPNEYLINSNQNIKEYLAGLIDGNLGNLKIDTHTIDITTRSKSFLNTLTLMFRSCGFVSTIKETEFVRYSTKRQKIENKSRIYSFGDVTTLPSIKCNKNVLKRKDNKDWSVTYFTCGKCENVEGYLIEIDDDACILTEDFFILS